MYKFLKYGYKLGAYSCRRFCRLPFRLFRIWRGMVLLPVITSVYGIELAIPISTIAQLLSNLSRAGLGFKQIQWRKVVSFLATAAPLTALGAIGFSIADKTMMTRGSLYWTDNFFDNKNQRKDKIKGFECYNTFRRGNNRFYKWYVGNIRSVKQRGFFCS